MILYFHDVSGVCFVIRDEPYGVNPTLTVGPTIRLISILIHCVQHWPIIEPTLAQRLVFVLKWLHRPIPQHMRPLALVTSARTSGLPLISNPVKISI